MASKKAYIDQFATDPYVRESVTTDAHGIGRLLSGRTDAEVTADPALKVRPIPAKPERRMHQLKLSSERSDPEDVGYDDGGGIGSRRCGACVHYIEGNLCQVVHGQIDPGGICDLFETNGDKTASARNLMLNSFISCIKGRFGV